MASDFTHPGSGNSNSELSSVRPSTNFTSPQTTTEDDDQPLLIRSLSRNLAESNEEQRVDPNSKRVLNMFFGVFVPVALSQFSTTVFLRLGYIIGQAGLLYSLLLFVVGYAILVFTVLSICAISTNGAVEGGGAYYMISRALGPEFGGSIGLLFFLANVFSCAVYVSGFVEGVTDTWGSEGGALKGQPLPTGYWYNYAYGTCVSLFCLGICMIGSKMYAKTSLAIFGVVVVCITMVIVSFFATKPKGVPIPCANKLVYSGNMTCDANNAVYGNYTGLSSATFKDNLYASFTEDYTMPSPSAKLTAFSVFAVLFSGITGIMNGANMSGELKNPGRDIPRGTLFAVTFTFTTYMILVFLTAGTSDRSLLQGDYSFMKDINLWPPFVYIGIFAATLSAALGNLIGASRVLEALSHDDQFWIFTRPARISTNGGNPLVAVVMSWVLVQCVLLIGAMNSIAPMTSVFFLLSYASVNLACLALDLASAPNFRPSFRFFNAWTCFLGFICCFVMTFLISTEYAAIALAVAVVLVIVLYFRSMSTSWGSISQALIFHQVRKYLLMLDSRKDHVKFWRPQLLFMVSNPRQSASIIDFINDMKKSGLYILGHVKVGKLDDCRKDPALTEQANWLSLVDYLNVKAFVEVTLANSVRDGLQQLVRLSGLGGMKPNTICFGFFDESEPKDTFHINRRKKKFGFGAAETAESNMAFNYFRLVRSSADPRSVNKLEYVHMINDCIKMQKNVCLFRHFSDIDKDNIFKSTSSRMNIDVWPVNMFAPDTASYMDNCSLFILQLACVLHMVKGWKQSTKIRVLMCHTGNEFEAESKKKKLGNILDQLRIKAEIIAICWSKVVDSHYPLKYRNTTLLETPILPEQYINEMNGLMKEYSNNSAVLYTYLPLPPSTSSFSEEYLHQLTLLTDGLPPTVLVHGLNPVTSTTL